MLFKNQLKEFSSSAEVRKEVYLFFFFIIAFIFFARYSDWNYDESTSYLGVQSNNAWDLLTYSKFKEANNHIFNSLFFRLLQQGHITAVVYYRILSIASFLIFFIANTSILKLLKINKWYIIFLTVAPYFFYFSLGRGYALAISSFVMSFFYLLQYTREQRVKYEYLLIFWGAVSCLSIFSFLYGFLSILIVFGIFKIRHLKSIHTFLLSLFVLAVLLYVYKMGKTVNESDPSIIGVKNFSLFKFGTVSSIFSDFSCREYLVNAFYGNTTLFRIITCFKLLIMLCVIAPMFYVRKINLTKIDPANIKTILGLLIVLPFLFMGAAGMLAHALYPLTRAVFYVHYLLLLFVLVATISYSKKIIFYIPLILLFCTSLIYTCYIYYDLSRPTIKDALVTTKNAPLYVVFTNDQTVKLINNLSGVHKPNITEGHQPHDIIDTVQKDTSNPRYIICWPQYTDSCLGYFKNTRVYKYRREYSFIEIMR